MDQVTLVKNQVRAENWSKLIEECQRSGQTVVRWCKENDVNIKTYYYWLGKFRQQEIEKRQLPLVAEIPEKPVTFQRLLYTIVVPLLWCAISMIVYGIITYILKKIPFVYKLI